MKILITTPSGEIGRRVLHELLAPEFSVRVIEHDPGGPPQEFREEVEIVGGATDDLGTWRRSLDGVEALFCCVPGEPFHETDVRGHYERFARACCQAIREARTPRVVTLSAVGKGLANDPGPISGLLAMEEILDESGTAIRHLRCGSFMENILAQARSIAARGVFSFPVPGHVPISLVAATDIADVVLRWLVRRDWNGIEDIGVYGPEDLSFEQAASVMEQILKQPVQYKEAPANQYVQSLFSKVANAEYAQSRSQLFVPLARGARSEKAGTTKTITPTMFATWVERELRPWTGSAGLPSGGSAAPLSCAAACSGGQPC